MHFQIGEKDFLLNGKPFKIISGAVHYFRIVPEYWYKTLFNLKAMGCNTVETYVPWNFHQPTPDNFHFSGQADLSRFLHIAQDLGLYAILRPTPYICAEWEMGGLPAWLLSIPNIKLRQNDPLFLAEVDRYFGKILPKIGAYQFTQGGNILMMQIENEYGSFGNDKNYLRAMKALMQKHGVEVPLFTSDGAWQNALEAGALIDDDILPTGNFGSRSDENLDELQRYMTDHGKQFPLMCMEFWDGWFNRWKEPVITRDKDDLVHCTKNLLDRASINFYMFQGGTNFGFWNGCSARGEMDLPQVTSYDYDAPVREWGTPSEKYYALQQLLKNYPDASEIQAPILPEFKAYPTLNVAKSVSLFETIDTISSKINSANPLSMEALNHYYGYVLYRANPKVFSDEIKLRIYQGRDRIQIFNDGEKVATQYREEIGSDVMLHAPHESFQLDLLVENMGRVNYGGKLLAPTQRKGIQAGVMLDLHFHTGWENYAIHFDQLENLDFSGKTDPKQPTFYVFNLMLDEDPKDTFIDTRHLGKGIIVVNGFNLGRYWCEGPTTYLYLPAPLLHQGNNEIIVFETEGIAVNYLAFSEQPIYKSLTTQNL